MSVYVHFTYFFFRFLIFFLEHIIILMINIKVIQPPPVVELRFVCKFLFYSTVHVFILLRMFVLCVGIFPTIFQKIFAVDISKWKLAYEIRRTNLVDDDANIDVVWIASLSLNTISRVHDIQIHSSSSTFTRRIRARIDEPMCVCMYRKLFGRA